MLSKEKDDLYGEFVSFFSSTFSFSSLQQGIAAKSLLNSSQNACIDEVSECPVAMESTGDGQRGMHFKPKTGCLGKEGKTENAGGVILL